MLWCVWLSIWQQKTAIWHNPIHMYLKTLCFGQSVFLWVDVNSLKFLQKLTKQTTCVKITLELYKTGDFLWKK